MGELEIRRTSYDDSDAMRLTTRLQAFYVERYGGEDSDPIEVASFSPPRGVFLVGYLDGVPVATGAWRRSTERALGVEVTAEIKRMHVIAEQQRRGFALEILTALEKAAVEAGIEALILETGIMQPEAIAFYGKHGYEPIPPFGHYAEFPNARSFGKLLDRP